MKGRVVAKMEKINETYYLDTDPNNWGDETDHEIINKLVNCIIEHLEEKFPQVNFDIGDQFDTFRQKASDWIVYTDSGNRIDHSNVFQAIQYEIEKWPHYVEWDEKNDYYLWRKR
jgi:hypothetical protein